MTERPWDPDVLVDGNPGALSWLLKQRRTANGASSCRIRAYGTDRTASRCDSGDYSHHAVVELYRHVLVWWYRHLFANRDLFVELVWWESGVGAGLKGFYGGTDELEMSCWIALRLPRCSFLFIDTRSLPGRL